MEEQRTNTKSDGPERLTLAIDDLNTAGDGVARHEGQVVFVRGAVPGDRVVARVLARQRRHLEARAEELLEPSPSRVEPPCAVQEACGGCPLMPLAPDAALGLKVRHLVETLRRVGRIEGVDVEAVSSPRLLEYRNRLRFTLGARAAGARVGFRPRGDAGGLVEVPRCFLAPARATELAHTIARRLTQRAPADAPWPTGVELRGSLAEGGWGAVLITPPGSWPGLRRVARELVAEEEGLVGLFRAVVRGRSPAGPPRLLAGRDDLRESYTDVRVPVGGSGFLQVNPAAAGLLYETLSEVLEPLGTGGRVLDLYCGIGITALRAARRGAEVLGVESHPGSVAAAEALATSIGEQRVTFLREDAGRAAARLAREGRRFDRVVLNPPRAGAHPAVLTAIAALAPRRIAIVSCHPAALARDLAALRGEGFELTRLVAVDLFPQTPHVEALAELRPADAT